MENMIFGLGRISTEDQNEARQREAFRALGIGEREIYIDACTGNAGHLEERKGYQELRLRVRKGDTIFLDALDRLGRNSKEIKQEWSYFTEEVGCYMVVLNMPVLDTRPKEGWDDVSQMISKVVLEIFAWMAEKETAERKRRQAAGIEIAKQEGKYTGRKPIEVDTEEFGRLFEEVRAGDRTNKSVMDKLGLTRTTYYKLVKEYKTKTERFAE